MLQAQRQCQARWVRMHVLRRVFAHVHAVQLGMPELLARVLPLRGMRAPEALRRAAARVGTVFGAAATLLSLRCAY